MLIHPSHQPAASQSLRAMGALFVLLFDGEPAALTARNPGRGALPLHMALETLVIVVAALTFGVVWSVRHERLPHNALLRTGFIGRGPAGFAHAVL